MPEPSLSGLADGTVDIGFLPLDACPDHPLQLLSPRERERAARFGVPAALAAYVQTRAALRRALGSYLGLLPAEVPISLGANGKLELTAGLGLPDLHFNVTHTRGLALCAFALGRRLGIDVEWRAPGLPWLDVATTAFSASELAALVALPECDRRMGFYACWTRKEAWLKGLGTGFLATDLSVTDVPVGPAAVAALRLRDSLGAAWSLCDLTIPGPPGDWAAALACEGAPPRLRWLSLSAAPTPNRSAA